MALAGNLLAVLLSLTGLRIPRLFTGSWLSALSAVLLILYYADLELEAAATIAGITALAGDWEVLQPVCCGPGEPSPAGFWQRFLS